MASRPCHSTRRPHIGIWAKVTPVGTTRDLSKGKADIPVPHEEQVCWNCKHPKKIHALDPNTLEHEYISVECGSEGCKCEFIAFVEQVVDA